MSTAQLLFNIELVPITLSHLPPCVPNVKSQIVNTWYKQFVTLKNMYMNNPENCTTEICKINKDKEIYGLSICTSNNKVLFKANIDYIDVILILSFYFINDKNEFKNIECTQKLISNNNIL